MFQLNAAIVLFCDFFEKVQWESFNFYEELQLLFQLLAESAFATADLVLFLARNFFSWLDRLDRFQSYMAVKKSMEGVSAKKIWKD